MNISAVVVVALALLVYGLVSRRLRTTPLTGPLLFTLFGLAVGDAGLGLVPMNMTGEALHLLAEVTLILVLFSDAASIDLKQLRTDHNLPLRMLVIGMPLTIVLGTGTAVLLFPTLSLWEAALLAAILDPTDAALGQAVVTSSAVPARIRLAINVESGLNDGIALPLVLLFGSLAAVMAGTESDRNWIEFGLLQITLGPLVGAAVGWLGARLVARAYARDYMSDLSEGIIALALASVLFLLLILEDSQIPGKDLIFSVVVCTVLLSVVLHGLTAGPGSRWYGAQITRLGECAETQPVPSEPFSPAPVSTGER